MEPLVRFVSASMGAWFSLLGDMASCMLSVPASVSGSIESRGSRAEDLGESSLKASEDRCRLRRLDRGEGVLAGEDF